MPIRCVSSIVLHNRLVSLYLFRSLDRNPTDLILSDYSAKVFGFATFGKVYGLIICLAGLFNFSQSALDALTHKAFDNNPVPVNAILLATALVVGSTLVIFVYRQAKTLGLQDLRAEAEGAEESLIPNAADVNGRDWGADSGIGHGYGSIVRERSPGS